MDSRSKEPPQCQPLVKELTGVSIFHFRGGRFLPAPSFLRENFNFKQRCFYQEIYWSLKGFVPEVFL